MAPERKKKWLPLVADSAAVRGLRLKKGAL